MKSFHYTLCVVIIFVFSVCGLFAGDINAIKVGKFEALGNMKGGMYKKISGNFANESIQITLKKIPHYNHVGGMTIETSPSFEISGKVSDSNLSLKIEAEDIITSVGSMKVLAGTIFHVKGMLGKEKIHFDIKEKKKTSNVGGMNILAERWKEVIAEDKVVLVFRTVSEITENGGIKVLVNRHHTLTGADKAGKVELEIRDFQKDIIEIKGSSSPLSVTLLMALRPFLLL